jgi:hypothetical protein
MRISEDRSHTPTRSALAAAAGVEAPLLPACVVCSREWSAKHALPAVVPVTSALLMREAFGRGYLAIVHCHGASCIVELGTETPSDNKIRTARAFA